MKKLLCAFLFLPSLVWADITVTPGAGKTVATTTDGGREFQNIVVSTMNVRNGNGVLAPVGYDTAVSSPMPVSLQGTSTVTVAAGSTMTVINPNGIAIKTDGSATTQPVSGTFWQATQPVSGTFFQGTQPVSVATPFTVITTTQGVNASTIAITNAGGVAIKVDGSAVTQPVSGTVSANQNGTWTVQPGNTANTTAWKVDGSAVTQPVSGTVSVNALPTGTNNIGTVNNSSVTIVAPNNNTTPIPVTGSFSSTTNNPSTATISATYPSGATAVGFLSPTGQIQGGRVDVSSNIYVNIAAGGGTGGTASTFSGALPSQGTPIGFVGPTGQMQAAKVDVSSNVFVSVQTALPTGTNNVGTVTGSTFTIQGSNGSGITSTAGALDINIKSGSIANTGFNVNNTPAVTQSGTWNIGTVTTLTGITNALPAGTNNIGTIGGLNNVVISSFAATSTPQVNVVMVASTPVVTAGGQAGEIRVSAEISGSSDTFQGGLAHNGAAAATNRLGTTPAIVQTTPANGTALTAGRDAALSVGTDGSLWTSNQPAMRPASYYASVSSASYTSTTDLACLPGNATNTVIVRRIVVSCTETTAGQVTVSVIRRSAADSGGTSASMPVGKDDSTSGSAVSVPLVYSAAPTKGTLDSFVDIQTIGCMASATASPNDVLVENWNDKAKVLRGTAQEFCVSLATPQDLAGTTVTGGNFNVHFEWSEITSITP